MRYLIINYYWEPMIDAHAYRWPQLAKELASQGHSVDVITSKIISMDNFDTEFGVSIKRVGVIASKNKLEQVEVTESIAKEQNIFKNKNKLKEVLIKVYKKFYWPDPLWHWLPSLVMELYKRRNTKYDFVISYYPCFAAHLGALIYKKFCRVSKFKWIADYGDPFSVSTEWPPNNYHVYRHLNKWIERLVYFQCDKFAVMNSETKRRYEEEFGKTASIVLVPHLAPRMEPVKIFRRKDTVVLRYIGSFHREVRDHLLLFELAKILARSNNTRYQIEIFGPTEYWSDIVVPNNIKILGKVARAEALSLLSSADVLINVSNTTKLMTPSKIIEYISTRRPIINVGGLDLGEYRPLIKYAEIGMCLNFSGQDYLDSPTIIEDFIEESINRAQMTDNELQNCLTGHTAEEILNDYGLTKKND